MAASPEPWRIAFAPRNALPKAYGKPKPIQLVHQDVLVRATLRIGRASATIELEASDTCPGIEPVQELMMVPSTCIDGSRRSRGILRLTGDRPAFSLCLKLSSEAEAKAVQEQLQATLLAVVHGLHLRELPGAPMLSLRWLRGAGAKWRAPEDRGSFLLGGYVVVGECVPLEKAPKSEVRWCLYWAELCGPDPEFEEVCIYCYSNHDRDAEYMDFYSLKPNALQVMGNVLRLPREQPIDRSRHYWEAQPDDCIALRSAEEARLWADIAGVALDGHGRRRPEEPVPQAAQRLAQVTAELERHRAAICPEDPLLVEISRSLAPEPQKAPTDAVATYWRKKEAQELQQLMQDVNGMQDQDVDLQGYESFGTTVLELP